MTETFFAARASNGRMCSRYLILLMLYGAALGAASLPVSAAGPPLPTPIVPNTAQQNAQTQLAIQQAQAQARLAASQAKVQAMLDANQARLEGQVAAQEQAQLHAARPRSAPAQLPPLPLAWPMQASVAGPAGTMQLTTLTPALGRYFGTQHGILVIRAPANGVLKLQDGDVILSIGGRTPASSSQAMRILTSYDPGEKVRMVVLREHHKMEITATMPAVPGGP